MAHVWTSFLVILVAVSFTMDALSTPAYRAAPMATTRADPYKNFRFRVKMDGRIVAGFAKVSGLQWPPVRSSAPFKAITLQQGVTHDAAFEHWASAVSNRQANTRRQADKKNVVIEALNEGGRVAKVYVVSHAWVSKYQGAPNLDASANEVAIELIELEHDGLTLK
jgi:phage tail-like protein